MSSPHYLTFSEEDEKSLSHPHNLALHIEIKIYQSWVKHALIDNGTRLKIFSFDLVKKLGLSEFTIDPRRNITIKAHDKVESSSKRLVLLPIWVRSIEKDMVF